MNRNPSLLSALRNAVAGIRYVITTQRNAKIDLVCTLLVLLCSLLFHLNSIEWIAILFAIGFVWTSECINTGIEKVTDLSSPEIHPLARVTKDSAAGGVLIAALIAAVIGLIIFLPKFIDLVR
jgi:diacylglycerol kinase